MKPDIISPIFIVGCYRSGTSIFHNKLASHPDLSFITRATKTMPSSLLLTRLLFAVRRSKKHRKALGGLGWKRFMTGDDDVRGSNDADLKAKRYFRKIVQNNLRIHGGARFVNKSPSNCFQIHFLKEIFPDAVFIHFVRDGRAVTQSILRGRKRKASKGKQTFGGAKFPGWQDSISLPLIESCAIQWQRTVALVDESISALPKGTYITIRYEDFVETPSKTAEDIGSLFGLTWTQKSMQDFCSGLINRNYKWQETFDEEQASKLNILLADQLIKFGYTVDH